MSDITNQIKEAEIKVTKALRFMDEQGINLDTIEAYNNVVVKLSDLQIKQKHLNKKQKPKQYMNELSLNGINLL